MFNLSEIQEEFLKKEVAKDQRLLEVIRSKLPDLERVEELFGFEREDGIYRFYHQSFKVYRLQDCTLKAVEIFRSIAQATENRLCDWFEEIVADGTGKTFEPEHNRNWTEHTRPIVEAFLHTRYFLEMMIKYANEMESPPRMLPFGWAAILELYNQR
ncbi:MAG TPA: hypothetical protein VFZ40_13855 [Pyrinomonadaceae bacterium]